jgi:hypothetical protein
MKIAQSIDLCKRSGEGKKWKSSRRGNFLPMSHTESPPPARQRGAEQKNCLYILILRAPHI